MRAPPPEGSRLSLGRRRRRRRFIAAATVFVMIGGLGVIPFVARTHALARASQTEPDKESESLPPLPPIPVKFPLGSWQIAGHAYGAIEGYAGKVSVLAGDRVPVYVRTRARTYNALVYRMGYYHGTGARLMTEIRKLPGTLQPPCGVETLGMVECRWRSSFVVDVSLEWPTGVYLIKLIASDGTQSFVPFVVRETTPNAQILFQLSVTTWQAYNTFGGRDLYQGPCAPRPPSPAPSTPSPSASPSPLPSMSATPPPSPSPSPSPSPIIKKVAFVRRVQSQSTNEGRGCAFAARSRAVSFDRPYLWPGTGQFFRFEYPFLYWLESKGYQVAYATDVDLQEGLDALQSRRIFISAGHDEYYSLQMRSALEDAVNSGTNVIFMGANDIYRHIRFQRSLLGADRVIINYKIAGEDPYSVTDPSQSTGQWREWPTANPEQQLLGAQYECNPVRAPWVPTGSPAWLFRGTGLSPGRAIPNLVGYEYDKTFAGQPHPADVVDIARSPLTCGGRESESDSTFYAAQSGAGVFDAGSLFFVCAMGPTSHACQRIPPDPRVQKLIGNLITAMLLQKFR